MQEIEAILDNLADLTGLMVIWKEANGSGCGFSARHTFHLCGFCNAVKSSPELLQHCSRNDSQLLAREAAQRHAPFLHRCHAGATELVIPLFENGRCRELLLAGVFRSAESNCPYPEQEAAFTALPCRNADTLRTVERLLASLVPLLRERRDRARLAEAGRTVRDARIAAVLAALRGNPGEKFTAAAFARRSNLSESRFIHLFKQETGLSFSDCLRRERLREARRLLTETDLPLSQIAPACGFHDQSHLGNAFRQETGLTPRAFRRRFGREKNF